MQGQYFKKYEYQIDNNDKDILFRKLSIRRLKLRKRCDLDKQNISPSAPHGVYGLRSPDSNPLNDSNSYKSGCWFNFQSNNFEFYYYYDQLLLSGTWFQDNNNIVHLCDQHFDNDFTLQISRSNEIYLVNFLNIFGYCKFAWLK